VKLPIGHFGDRNWSTVSAFVLACLGGAAWMRLIVRQWLIEPGTFFGLGSLLIGCLIAWVALQYWRRSAPYRCAVIVGLCGGVAGAGAVILLRAFS
jgi:fluoride ion exporter CrcB/FEX